MFFIKNLGVTYLSSLLISFYKHHNTPKGVFWNSKLSQDLRLNIIINKFLSLCMMSILANSSFAQNNDIVLLILIHGKRKGTSKGDL